MAFLFVFSLWRFLHAPSSLPGRAMLLFPSRAGVKNSILRKGNPALKLEIGGHTDATGPKTLNERLGEQRAEAVRLFMNQHGVPLISVTSPPTAAMSSAT